MHEGQHYLVMDYVAGRSLAEVISELRFEISNPRIGVHRGDDGDQPVSVDYGTVDGTALGGRITRRPKAP
jgi:hypothetical protein